MRYFRIVSFTGIETHRDDADRGSLRVLEGCIPHGQGGLRSGPLWEKLGDIEECSTNSENHLHGADDENGNSLLFASRAEEVHDIHLFSEENVPLVSIGSNYPVVNSSNYVIDKSIFSPIGNRLYSFGDGSAEAIFVGLGNPVSAKDVFPDLERYHQEWSKFPKCTMFLVGQNKSIFASGNPESPLTVYISEPAGMTDPDRDSPYSTSSTDQNPGKLSSVDILMSDAKKITALSVKMDTVIVHTDKGCHLLYTPEGDQASTGYRAKQSPSGVFSAAVNQQVVRGEKDQKYWLGHDKQIYKDESATRSAEGAQEMADRDQASAKSKGEWDRGLPKDLSQSFSTYSSEGGMYWLYVESDEYKEFYSSGRPGQIYGLRVLSRNADLINTISLSVSSTESDLPVGVTINATISGTDLPESATLEIENIISDPLPFRPGSPKLFDVESIIQELPPEITDLDVEEVISNLVEKLNLEVEDFVSDKPSQVTIDNLTVELNLPHTNTLVVNVIVADAPSEPQDFETNQPEPEVLNLSVGDIISDKVPMLFLFDLNFAGATVSDPPGIIPLTVGSAESTRPGAVFILPFNLFPGDVDIISDTPGATEGLNANYFQDTTCISNLKDYIPNNYLKTYGQQPSAGSPDDAEAQENFYIGTIRGLYAPAGLSKVNHYFEDAYAYREADFKPVADQVQTKAQAQAKGMLYYWPHSFTQHAEFRIGRFSSSAGTVDAYHIYQVWQKPIYAGLRNLSAVMASKTPQNRVDMNAGQSTGRPCWYWHRVAVNPSTSRVNQTYFLIAGDDGVYDVIAVGGLWNSRRAADNPLLVSPEDRLRVWHYRSGSCDPFGQWEARNTMGQYLYIGNKPKQGGVCTPDGFLPFHHSNWLDGYDTNCDTPIYDPNDPAPPPEDPFGTGDDDDDDDDDTNPIPDDVDLPTPDGDAPGYNPGSDPSSSNLTPAQKVEKVIESAGTNVWGDPNDPTFINYRNDDMDYASIHPMTEESLVQSALQFPPLANHLAELIEIFNTLKAWDVNCYWGVHNENGENRGVFSHLALGWYQSSPERIMMINTDNLLYIAGLRFLYTMRHEAVHAAQDVEAERFLSNQFGGSVPWFMMGQASLMQGLNDNLVEGLMWYDAVGNADVNFAEDFKNQHGIDDVNNFYIGNSQGTFDLNTALIELEGNSAEVNENTARLARVLANDNTFNSPTSFTGFAIDKQTKKLVIEENDSPGFPFELKNLSLAEREGDIVRYPKYNLFKDGE